MSGAGTTFVSQLKDTFRFDHIYNGKFGPTAYIEVNNAELDLTSDDIDALIETLNQIKKELNT